MIEVKIDLKALDAPPVGKKIYYLDLCMPIYNYNKIWLRTLFPYGTYNSKQQVYKLH